MKEANVPSLRTSEQSGAVVRAMTRLFYALVGLFCQFPIRGDVMVDILRHGILRYALESSRDSDDPSLQRRRPLSLTRLIMLTGLDSRTIKGLLRQPISATDGDLCPEAAILGSWAKDPTLRDPITGRPKDLSIYGPTGTLEGLVHRHAGRGVSVTYVLDRLVKNGNVKQLDKLYARLINPNWKLFEHGEDTFLSCAIDAVVQLCNTIGHNLKYKNEPEKKWVERQAFSYMIPKERRAEAERAFNELLMRQWEEANQLIRSFEASPGETCEADESLGMRYCFIRLSRENPQEPYTKPASLPEVKAKTGPWRGDSHQD